MLKRAHIICITSGGKLLEFAKEYNFLYIRIPDGSNSARAMIGYLIVSLLSALYHTNLIGAAFIRETENAIDYLDRHENSIQAEAESIAKKLKSKLPVIYCDGRLQAMALRFQQQLNENANQLAHVNTFPEMNHNEIMGWQFPDGVLSRAQVVYLCSDQDHQRVDKRMEMCRSIFERHSDPIINIVARGASLLEQYYYLIHITDWISYFLAVENQVDPDATEAVLFLKEELAKIK